MRILWITGSLLPEAIAKIRGDEVKEWNTTGSWILGAADALKKKDGIKLYMAATSQLVSQLIRIETDGIISYAIPYGKGHYQENAQYDKYMKEIHEEVMPDIVHIHGTEYSHSWAYLKVCGGKNAVISIQGMTSVISRYFHTGMSIWDILKNTSFRDLIRGGIFHEKKSFKKRGKLEQRMICSVAHVIGRTTWDYAHTKAINPSVIYHHNDETLRDVFYSGAHWEYTKCTPHTIVAIMGYQSPFKGLHQLIKALPLILQNYPDTKIRVCGEDPTFGYNPTQWWRVTGYGRYIKSLIRQLNLREHITFLGPKDAQGIKEELLHSNVFVCPSSIENSSNAIGEAQIIGVPCIAAYVGGVMDTMEGCEENLYRYEEIEMLAEKVCRVFKDKENQTDMSAIAAQRHDPQKNVNDLLEIYHQIMKQIAND